jgi:ribose/xylose/arabinose/galactoside ABC-type transport system permease subunit
MMKMVKNAEAEITRKRKFPSEIVVLVAFVLLFIAFSIISPNFITLKNLMNVLMYASILGVIATAMTMVILSGGLDISVGSVIGLTATITAVVVNDGYGVVAGIASGVVVGGVCGLINGFSITILRVNPLITTLATMSLFRGIAGVLVNGISVVIVGDEIQWIGMGYIADIIPICSVIMLASFAVIWYVLKYTPFGRKVYAIGGNAEASRLAGINVRNVRLIIYIVCGLMAGLGGVIMASQTGCGVPMAGEGYEMDVIAAVILGGTALSGGKGKILGTLIGVLILAVLSNGLTLLSVGMYIQKIIKGLVLLGAVVFDVVRGGGYK